MNNLLDILNKSVNYLEKKNIKNARLTAESIISEVMEMERIMLYAEFERMLSEDDLKKIREKLNDIVNDDKKISDNNDFENNEKSEKQLKLLLDKSISYLKKNNIDESRLIAEIVFSHVLNIDRMMLFTKYRDEIENEKIEKIRYFIQKNFLTLVRKYFYIIFRFLECIFNSCIHTSSISWIVNLSWSCSKSTSS